MNKMLVIIGAVMTLGGLVSSGIVLLQPPTINCVGNICEQKPPDGVYVTSLLPIFLLSGGIWMLVVGIKK